MGFFCQPYMQIGIFTMMTTEEIKSELKTKERSVADLLRFITTRSDDAISNYNLLLGSGCSVTSGINSGGQLIEQWRKEVYENLDEDKDKEYSQDKAIDFLSKNHGGWYNRNNEYSSLFEKKYDLARQRRMFVEQEVKDKTPSIGYAYLVNLIKMSYFNTIFTTNFDDLINEAFYQFSDTRPMVCAHDSSINSITVTSKRPKIIKLHGDYLFDDIKTTLRETESLEENIRNKFIEFAKDFGLIVVGYGGNDRSIMDVLTFLLKHEDYYKGGIYWCLRKGDIIGEDLRKLLWKDKVYFIEIDGFDELFAHLHHKIYKDTLPIDTNFISNKSQDIIHKFVTNPRLMKSGSKIIQEDLKNLKYQSERNNIYDLIKQMQSDKDLSDGKLENRELVLIFKITNLLKEHQYKEALELSEESLNNTLNKHLKVELLKKIVTAHARLENQSEAKKANDKLIEIEPNNPSHLLKRFDLEKLFEDKLKWINQAIELDSYNSDLYNEKISILINNYDFTIENNESGLLEITDLLNKSIEINPSINNSSWDIKFDFLKKIKYKDYKVELNNIINELSKQDPYSISVLGMKYSLITDNNERETFLEEIKIAKKNYLHENKLGYELFFLSVLDDINDKNKIEENLKNLSSNDLYNKDHVFLREKANLLFKKFDKLSESILVLEESLKIKKSNKSILQLIEYLICSENLDKAK